MSDVQQFLDDCIRKICGLAPDFEITEDFLRETLDEVDLQATKMDPGFVRRHPGMKLLTHDESIAQHARVRAMKF